MLRTASIAKFVINDVRCIYVMFSSRSRLTASVACSLRMYRMSCCRLVCKPLWLFWRNLINSYCCFCELWDSEGVYVLRFSPILQCWRSKVQGLTTVNELSWDQFYAELQSSEISRIWGSLTNLTSCHRISESLYQGDLIKRGIGLNVLIYCSAVHNECYNIKYKKYNIKYKL